MGQVLQDSVKARQNAGKQIDEIVFTPGGGFVMLSEGYYHGEAVQTNLWAAIKDTDRSKRRPRRIAIGADGRWILLGEQWFASGGCTTSQRDGLKSWEKVERSIDHVVLGVGDDYVFFSHHVPVLKPASPLLDLEYALVDANGVTKNIWQRLDELGVPGISIAVIDGNAVRWARGYGELEAGSDRWVRVSTPYSVASLSKYVSALTAMRKVKDGTIAFGTDARAMVDQGYPRLAWWEADGSSTWYGTALPYGLTLRRLLSHTAAMNNNSTNDGWGGMIDGGEISTISILLGYGCSGGACALGTKKVWHDPALGTPSTATYSYSNSGYEVVRAMLEDLEGQEYEEIAQAEVLGPLGMVNSTFEQPLPASFETRSAPPLDANGNALPRESYQWSAGGGLYASAEDYAKAMLVLIDLPATHASDFLDAAQTSEMLEDQNAADGSLYGFGIQLNESQVDAVSGRFAHGGSIPSYSWTRMVGAPSEGVGIVILTNSNTTNGRRLVCEIEKAFRQQFGFSLPSGC
jgi:CubicO group peptidase (beta-lactamase class C family)